MKPFFSLMGLSFKSLVINSANLGRSRAKRSQAVTGVGAMLLIGAVLIYLSGTFSFMLGSILAPEGGLDIMLGFMMIMGTVWPLFFILFGSQGLIFSTKDVDLVLSLPVSSFTVMLARVLALYLEALLMCQLMLLPAGAAYIWYGGANGVMVLLCLIAEGFFMALLPTFAALLFGALVALVVSRLPFKNLFTVLFSLLLVLGILAISMSTGFLMEGEGSSLLFLREAMAGVPPLHWAIQGALGNVGYLLLFAAMCVVPFLAMVWIFSRFYKGILTRLSSHRLRTDYKLRDIKTRSSFSALLSKETRRLFGTPALLLNSGLLLVFVIIACVVAAFYRDNIEVVLAAMAQQVPGFQGEFLLPLLLASVSAMCSFVFLSCVSISLEGKTLWILKEAPIGTGRIFAAKVGINFLLGAVTTVVAYPLLAYAFSLGVVGTLLMMVTSLLFCLLSSMLGLLVNLLLPRMDAENETIVIKQSASVIVYMLAAMVLIALFVLLYFGLRSLVSFPVFCLLASALLALLIAGTAVLLNTWGRRLFAAL